MSELERRRLAQLLRDDVCQRLGIFAITVSFRLSVVMPVYNERQTLRQIVARVLEQPFTIVHQRPNQGKGAAIQAGLLAATGDSGTTPAIASSPACPASPPNSN